MSIPITLEPGVKNRFRYPVKTGADNVIYESQEKCQLRLSNSP
jgi:hypothetical protein